MAKISNDDGRPGEKVKGCMRRIASVSVAFILIAASALTLPIWVWYWWRIEPENGEFAILIRKTGADLPAGEIVATRDGQKGVQLEVLPEGRYFRNPYDWDWKIQRVVDIPAGVLGVRVRLFGDDLPPGEIIAREGTKGIESDVMAPGKYRINPYAYSVIEQKAIEIRPGCVGVKTSLVGSDIIHSVVPATDRNTFLVQDGLKGVCPDVLDPGTHYLNPFIWAIVEVNLQSQRFEMSNDAAVVFLTSDGFPVRVEGTIEFNIRRDSAALLTHKVGDMEDIVCKLILPRTRGFIRIEGSKKPAVDFIVGETRQEFQNNLERHLKEKCNPFGVSINSVLIRNIIPPDEIAKVIRDREMAAQEARKCEQQIEQAKSKGELVRQEMLAVQNSRKVEAETLKIKARIEAMQEQSVNVLSAKRELEVAKIDIQTADQVVAANLLEAEAKRDVIRMSNEAEAGVLARKASAFGGGMGWADYTLSRKLAPRVSDVMATFHDASKLLPFPDSGQRIEKVESSGKEVSQ